MEILRKNKKREQSSLRYELLGIFFITIGAISLIALFGFNAGMIGMALRKLHMYIFGFGACLMPLLIILIGFRYVWRHKSIHYTKRFFGVLAMYCAILALGHHFLTVPGREILPESLLSGGGMIGGGILFVLRKFFGVDGSLVILLAIVVGSILISTTWSLAAGLTRTKKTAVHGMNQAKDTLSATYEKLVEAVPITNDKDAKVPFYNQEKEKNQDKDDYNQSEISLKTADEEVNMAAEADPEFGTERPNQDLQIQYAMESTDTSSEEPSVTQDDTSAIATNDDSVVMAFKTDNYKLPMISAILKKINKVKNAKLAKEIADNAKTLEETLASFHVKAKIINACNGPAVTRYELEPAAGVKVSKIVNLADDLALKLAAPGVRIEAPIPGKAAIGIEVPNKELSGVHLREVLEGSNFLDIKSRLTVGLGMDIGGQAIVADLGKMPHLLVAGATGSGKSVCINTIITSILFKATPEEVKFILIDPKMVELSNYNGIPHLMVPVVTDAKKAASVLNWAVQEMEKRYARFAARGVRDMERYNRNNDDDKMAAIVIIIDELADLMMVAANDVEDAICRLAQKARAAGIHLVLATQRPSVDVITGIIKANIPSRISFSVSSQIDSRTILDMSGAEKLLGKGDMLYYPIGAAKPLRVQGAFIGDEEVEELLAFIRTQGEPEENEEIISFTEQATAAEAKTANNEFQDELLEKAIDMVFETGQASASMLQRRLRVGYTRAARLIDTMEEMRIVGPNVGSKAREILMTSTQVKSLYFSQE